MSDPAAATCNYCRKVITSPRWNQRFCGASCKAKAKYRRDGARRKLRVANRLSPKTLTARTAELCDHQERQKPVLSPWLKVMAEVLEAEMQVRRWGNRLAERLENKARIPEPAFVIVSTQFIARNLELKITAAATVMGISCTDGTMAVALFAAPKGNGLVQ